METQPDNVKSSIVEWFRSPKTWIAGGVLLFTLGGSVTMFHETLIANESIIKETHKLVVNHEQNASLNTQAVKQASTEQQQLLKEIVRVMKINCLNFSKDDATRRACVGAE